MRTPSRYTVWLALVLAQLLGGCAGRAVTFPDASSDRAVVDGSPSDVAPDASYEDRASEPGDTVIDAAASDDAVTHVSCPSTPPIPGSACEVQSLACMYGSQTEYLCRPTYVCSEGVWSDAVSSEISAQFFQTRCTGGVGNSLCPTAPPTDAMACNAAGQLCAYPGRSCACVPRLTEDGGPPRAYFVCADSCGAGWPDVGSACTPSSIPCMFAGYCDHLYLSCVGGRWRLANSSC